jgi:hypothetical protein
MRVQVDSRKDVEALFECVENGGSNFLDEEDAEEHAMPARDNVFEVDETNVRMITPYSAKHVVISFVPCKAVLPRHQVTYS